MKKFYDRKNELTALEQIEKIYQKQKKLLLVYKMQNLWDSNKGDSKINLIVCGSVHSIMKKYLKMKKNLFLVVPQEKSIRTVSAGIKILGKVH